MPSFHLQTTLSLLFQKCHQPLALASATKSYIKFIISKCPKQVPLKYNNTQLLLKRQGSSIQALSLQNSQENPFHSNDNSPKVFLRKKRQSKNDLYSIHLSHLRLNNQYSQKIELDDCQQWIKIQIKIQMQGMKSVNIWEQAVKQKNKDLVVSSSQRILLVLGGVSVGKTSFLRVIKNELDTQVKPTYLLDYSYIRKGHARKQLIHCYEVASKNQSDIIPSLFTKDNFANVTVAICVDLSRPASLIEDVNEWLSILKKEMGNILHQKIGMQERYTDWLSRKKTENSSHEDAKTIVTAPLNVVFVGCKYDLFQKYETENRRWLSKAIRYLAHINNASLAFCSTSKNSPLGGQLRSFMQEVMFQDKPKVVSQRDHLKPIFVYRNQDTLNHISVPSSGSLSGLEVLKRQLAGLFGAEQEKKKQGIDITKYYQSKIENLIQERKKEMAKISKGLNKRTAI